MLGLSLICDLVTPIDDQLITRLVNDDGNDGKATQIIWRDPNVVLLFSGYPGYPVETYGARDYLICVEGRVYQTRQASWCESLAAVAADIVSGESHALTRAARYLAQIDGDFVVVFQDRRSRDVVIFGDRLGRLPLYVHRTDSALVVSRTLSLVSRVMGKAKFDRLAIAEYLVYGYPLGARTLLDDTERLPPGGTIQVRRGPQQIRVSCLGGPSVASDPGMTRGRLEEVARELSETFKQACAARVIGSANRTLGLSGGLDSRSVAAGLSENHLAFLAVTRASGASDREAWLASKVAEVLQLNWRTYRMQQPTGADLLRLLRMKSGLNHLGMASLLRFFDSLGSEFGREMIFLTGDGGDKIFRDHRPVIRIQSRQALVNYVLACHSIFPLSAVAALTGVSSMDVTAALEARIHSYPEDNLDERYIHFLLFERAFKWAFEGEDRNRHFFWSVAPLYGLSVFNQAMRCPLELKSNYGLYRFFLQALRPQLVDVESTTCGRSVRFEGQPLRQLHRAARRLTRDLAPLSLKRRWKALTSRPVTAGAIACLRHQLVPSSPVTGYLSPPNVTGLLRELIPLQADMLLTLTSAIEYMTTGNSTLERYGDVVF